MKYEPMIGLMLYIRLYSAIYGQTDAVEPKGCVEI